MRLLCGVGCLAVAVGLGAGAAQADVSTERSASLLFFPKVIADGTRDTLIQISNTSNQLVRAHCFYVNAALTDPTQPQGPFNPPLWQETDFDIVLTRQQPTHWIVSRGRAVDPTDPACSELLGSERGCEDAGFDPGRVPPVLPDFRGELKCIEVDDSGAPLSGNHFKGEATLITVGLDGSIVPGGTFVNLGDTASYNAIGILGNDNNGDGTLVLGGGQCVGDGDAKGAVCSSDDDCGDAAPCTREYNACPQTWILNHTAEDAPELVLEDGALLDIPTERSFVETELTIVPCTENFETQQPTSVTIQFLTFNEFESQLSVSTTVTCWGNFKLSEVGATGLTFLGQILPDPQGTMYLQTRLRSAAASASGVVMVAEETHAATSSLQVINGQPQPLHFASRAAVNLHIEGERATPDIITIPAEQLVP